MAKKVALYCRVSTKEQTTDNQTLDLKRFCEHRDLEIVQEYSDQGVSGSLDSRPALNQMLEDAKAGKFEILLVWKLDIYADAGVKSYTYNSVGQRTTQADQNNNQFSYVFDNLHRLTEVNVVPGAGVGGTTQQVFVYDNMSRLTNAKDITPAVTNEVARNYNILGRLTSETQKIGTTTIKTIAKEYNLVGRVSKLTYPNGRINEYTFDNNHLPNTIVSNSTTVATYTFNGVNAPTTKTLGNTVSLNIEYNNRYQITKHDWKKNGITIAGYNYGQDSVGNRIWSENLVTANKSELFAFDNADRLTSFKTGTLNGTKTSITSQTYSQIWTLDSIGN